MSSSRLPGKVLLPLEGATVLERVIERVSGSKLVDKVLVATTNARIDSQIVRVCRAAGISVYRGSEDDVLDRYHGAASRLGVENIVRICADSPLLDPAVLDGVVRLHLSDKADYTNNDGKRVFPEGERVEVFTFAALKKAWNEATLLSEREHVTPYMKKHPELFRISRLECETDCSDKRWTLDREADYRFISEVYSRLFRRNGLFGMKEILALLKKEPHLEKINKGTPRDEGYLKSVMEDRVMKRKGKSV